MGFELIAHKYQRARSQHKCWCCGQPIRVGEKYFRTSGNMNGKMFTVKYCRACECTADMLDQRSDIRPAVFEETLHAWLDANDCENET